MRKLLNRSLLTLGAAIVAVVFATSSAFASVWTVANGGDITLTGVTTFGLGDGGPFTCQTVIVVNLPDGTVSGPQIGSIVSITFSGCSGIIPFTVAASGLPYALNADSQSGTVVSGSITGAIALRFSSSVGCSTTVTGTLVPATYDNSDFTLSVPGTGQDLVLSGTNVAGCQGLLHDGDHARFSGDYVNQTAPTTINLTG